MAVYSISARAGRVGFGSDSAQLVPGDTNGHYDSRRLRAPPAVMTQLLAY